MAKLIILDVIHLTLLVPTGLDPTELQAHRADCQRRHFHG